MNKKLLKTTTIITILCMVLTVFTVLDGNAYAASKSKKPGKTTVTSVSKTVIYNNSNAYKIKNVIKYKKVSKVKGYAIYRNGKLIKRTTKTKYNDIVTSPGKTFKYKVRTYKTFKQKQYYNSKTKKWQAKKPKKSQWKGKKTRKVLKYKYGKFSNTKSVTTPVRSKESKALKTNTITASNMTLNIGESKNINAKCTSGATNFKYTCYGESIISVSSAGVVTAKKTGTAEVHVYLNATSNYTAADKYITVNVNNNTNTGSTGSNTETTTTGSTSETHTHNYVKYTDPNNGHYKDTTTQVEYYEIACHTVGDERHHYGELDNYEFILYYYNCSDDILNYNGLHNDFNSKDDFRNFMLYNNDYYYNNCEITPDDYILYIGHCHGWKTLKNRVWVPDTYYKCSICGKKQP